METDDGMAELRALVGGPPAAEGRGAAIHHHLGITTSRVDWESEVEARVVSASGRVCARPERVSLDLRHTEHRVRIASELPRGSCLFRETEKHERRHVAVNRATLRRAAADAEAAVRAWAAQAVGRGATEAEATADLQAGLRAAIAPAMEAMRNARDAGHGRIDGPEEYRRLGRVCADDQRALRERLSRDRRSAAARPD